MPMLPSRETASYQWVLSRFQPSLSISGGVHLFCFTKAARTKKKHKNRWHHSSRLFCGSAPLFFGHRYTNRVSLLGTSLGQHMCITIRGGAKYIKHRQTGSSLLHRAIWISPLEKKGLSRERWTTAPPLVSQLASAQIAPSVMHDKAGSWTKTFSPMFQQTYPPSWIWKGIRFNNIPQ